MFELEYLFNFINDPALYAFYANVVFCFVVYQSCIHLSSHSAAASYPLHASLTKHIPLIITSTFVWMVATIIRKECPNDDQSDHCSFSF